MEKYHTTMIIGGVRAIVTVEGRNWTHADEKFKKIRSAIQPLQKKKSDSWLVALVKELGHQLKVLLFGARHR